MLTYLFHSLPKQIKILVKHDSGAHTAFAHRGRQNHQNIQVPCYCFKKDNISWVRHQPGGTIFFSKSSSNTFIILEFIVLTCCLFIKCRRLPSKHHRLTENLGPGCFPGVRAATINQQLLYNYLVLLASLLFGLLIKEN